MKNKIEKTFPNPKNDIERAVNVFNAPKGTVQQKISFMQNKGMDQTDILEALNIASNGELLNQV